MEAKRITMFWTIKKFAIQFLLIIFILSQIFSLPSRKELKEIKVLPRSEIFFTQMENCYVLEIPDVEPGKVQMDLPELPLGTRFISSKKEEFIAADGKRGTQISLWFTFTESAQTRLSPLMTRINGRTYFFEFEPTYVYENPNLISPVIDIVFDEQKNIVTDKKTGQKSLTVKKGEKISFTAQIRYAAQIYDFKWILPKDSIFKETKRFDFAFGNRKITEFTAESQKLASFEWQILKEGEYSLPEVFAETLSYNGAKKRIYTPKDTIIIVKSNENQLLGTSSLKDSEIFESAFQKTGSQDISEKNSERSKEEYAKLAEKETRSILQKLFGKKFAIFAGGTVLSVPEEKITGQNFAGGQKVSITEQAGDWSFIECKEFSGWTKNDNIFEIK